MKKLLFLALFSSSIFAQYNRVAQSIQDTTTKLQWADDINAQTKNDIWHLAETYCTQSKLMGYDDWRLPSLRELLSIQKALQNKKIFKNVADDSYWTSTPNDKYGKEMRCVYSKNGFVSTWNACDSLAVRCVRKYK